MGNLSTKLFRSKSIADLQQESKGNELRRQLGPVNLILLGVGCAIGTGIFVLTGHVAAANAGPAVILCFVLAGLASLFAALCYSEFASLVPVAGSAYTYSYATMGEFVAWIIGWDLILEYAVGSIAVSVGWSGYVASLLNQIGWGLPPELTAAHGTLVTLADGSQIPALFNLPAVFIVAFATIILVLGVQKSSVTNNIIVYIKLAVVLLFIIGGAHAVHPSNWHPFIPPAAGDWGHFGWGGVLRGTGIVFFAYLGFDAVSTAAQESKNPKRDMPIGLLGSLLVITILYILVAAVATGVTSYTNLDVPAPIAHAADLAGMGWMATLIKIGAIAGLTSVMLVLLYGQSRIFWNMSRDGLLPPVFGRVHPRFKTPWITSLVTGAIVAFFAACVTVEEAGNLASIGTLLAFAIVSISVMILRVRQPGLERPFRTPWIWLTAPLGVLSAAALMAFLPAVAWIRLLVWMALGLAFYFAYGFRKSRLGKKAARGD
jgi:APA family basic amino acid/polyamine antiporter